MKVAVIEGDGIGQEVIPPARDAIGIIRPDIEFFDVEAVYGRWQRTGDAITDDDIALLASADAILFGAVTTPPAPDYRSVIVRIRKELDLYANVRPVWGEGFDIIVVRENTEDFYVGIGSRFRGAQKKTLTIERELYHARFNLDIESDADELAYQIGVITREGAERVISYAFDLAGQRKKKRKLDGATAIFTFEPFGYSDTQFLRVTLHFTEGHISGNVSYVWQLIPGTGSASSSPTLDSYPEPLPPCDVLPDPASTPPVLPTPHPDLIYVRSPEEMTREADLIILGTVVDPSIGHFDPPLGNSETWAFPDIVTDTATQVECVLKGFTHQATLMVRTEGAVLEKHVLGLAIFSSTAGSTALRIRCRSPKWHR